MRCPPCDCRLVVAFQIYVVVSFGVYVIDGRYISSEEHQLPLRWTSTRSTLARTARKRPPSSAELEPFQVRVGQWFSMRVTVIPSSDNSLLLSLGFGTCGSASATLAVVFGNPNSAGYVLSFFGATHHHHNLSSFSSSSSSSHLLSLSPPPSPPLVIRQRIRFKPSLPSPPTLATRPLRLPPIVRVEHAPPSTLRYIMASFHSMLAVMIMLSRSTILTSPFLCTAHILRWSIREVSLSASNIPLLSSLRMVNMSFSLVVTMPLVSIMLTCFSLPISPTSGASSSIPH